MFRPLVIALLALAACTDPHQLVLSIRTSAGVPCDIDRVRVVATAGGETTIDETLRGERLPVEVTLLDATPTGTFQVAISGYKGNVEVLRTSGTLRFADHASTAAVMLESRCRPEVGCGLTEAMAAAADPAPPDPACVADVTRYTTATPIDPPSDACAIPGSARVLGERDGRAGPVELADLALALAGDHFQLYGRTIGQVWVAREGYVSFATANPDPAHTLQPGPLDRDIRHEGAAPPVHSVFAFWDALTLSPAGICYAIDGEPGHHVLRVSWPRACLMTPCTTDNLNFTIALEEDSGRVLVTYGAMSAGNMERAQGTTATVGIVDNANGCVVEECALATGLCKDGHTPCGYSQVFSNTAQPDGVRPVAFTPVIDL
jgi:hypothetical protein